MILIGGGTGFIGRHLVNKLRSNGRKVLLISRNPGLDRITWDDITRSGIPSGCKAVVNMSGRNVLEPSAWLCVSGQSSSYPKALVDSRVGTTQLLARAIKASNEPPSVLVNASAIAFYDPNNPEPQDEDTPGGTHDGYIDFLVSKWEAAAQEVTECPSTRLVTVRIGVVLGRDGGVLQQTYWPFYLGLGGRVASGKQAMPWIHIDDIVGILEMAVLNPEVKGVLNGVAPNCVTNEEYTKALGSSMGRPTVFPMPAAVMRLAFGNRASLVLECPRVVPRRVLEYGYQFKFDDVQGALNDLCK